MYISRPVYSGWKSVDPPRFTCVLACWHWQAPGSFLTRIENLPVQKYNLKRLLQVQTKWVCNIFDRYAIINYWTTFVAQMLKNHKKLQKHLKNLHKTNAFKIIIIFFVPVHL